MRKAFTLIELLIVVLLIGIVYGIYFFTSSKNVKEEKFSLFKVKEFLNAKSKVYGETLTIICDNDTETCFLLDKDKTIVEEFDFFDNVKTFKLMENELLDPVRYKNIELSGSLYFEPDLIFKKLNKRQFETLIYYTSGNTWVYISPYFLDTKEFINKEDIIAYIKKREYLPMQAGLVE